MGDIENIARALCKSSGDAPECWKAYEEQAAAILADIENLKKIEAQNPASEPPEVCADTDEYIDLCVGVSGWRNLEGMWIAEDDYRVSGEVWRVHKGDADPFPSRPHAHCIAGAKRFVGCKLHLGTAQLYKGSAPLGRILGPKQFERLIVLIRPKFPELILPLPSVT